jgi:hypothetical protein
MSVIQAKEYCTTATCQNPAAISSCSSGLAQPCTLFADAHHSVPPRMSRSALIAPCAALLLLLLLRWLQLCRLSRIITQHMTTSLCNPNPQYSLFKLHRQNDTALRIESN